MKNEESATFWEHVEELRKTLLHMLAVLFIGICVSFAFYEPIFSLLTSPLHALTSSHALVILGPMDGFQIILKVCFWFSLTATSPIWLFLLLRFISPALRQHERQFVVPFLVCSALFVTAGLLFAFFVTIPLANQILYDFNNSLGNNLWTLNHYLDYTVLLLLANALAFELTVVFLFLIQSGWMSSTWLREKRRVMIVLIFVISAVLTPPDVLTQLLMAVPLMILYEGIILYARWREAISQARRRDLSCRDHPDAATTARPPN